jgi:histidinol-phosphate phosphatase family protein
MRAATLTADRIPKALLPVGNVPIILRQLRALQIEGVTHVTILAGHLGELLRSAVEAEAVKLGITQRFILEAKPLGTAGSLAAIDPGVQDTLIVYGDMLFDISLAPLQEFHRRLNVILTLIAHPNDHPRTSDLIIEEDGLVQRILPRMQPRAHDYRNLVPAGLYLATPAFFRRLQPGVKADMINDVLPVLIASGERIGVYNTPEYLRDIGSPARYAQAEHDLRLGIVETLKNSHKRPAIFFDCDGVLNEEPGDPGVVTPDDVKLIPGAGVAVRRARAAGLLAVAVTNRPQVAKGVLTFEELDRILGRIEALLAEDGGVLDRIYFCPHHPDSGFPGEIQSLKVSCECRKPGIGLFQRALAELPIDPTRSMLIGDSLRDIGAARGIGIWAYGVRTGYGCRDGDRYPRHHENAVPPASDLMFETVAEAVDFGIGYRGLAASVLAGLRPLLSRKARTLVGISGRSRSGKTTVAHAAVRSLTEDGTACLHVRLDDWLIPISERGPQASAEMRAQVNILPELLAALRRGSRVHAPGYNAATRGVGEPVTYDASDKSVIVVEGSFATHKSIRSMLDFAVFTAVPAQLQRQRFDTFYLWKGLEQEAIDELWRERMRDEWPAVDAQCERADLVLTLNESQ